MFSPPFLFLDILYLASDSQMYVIVNVVPLCRD